MDDALAQIRVLEEPEEKATGDLLSQTNGLPGISKEQSDEEVLSRLPQSPTSSHSDGQNGKEEVIRMFTVL